MQKELASGSGNKSRSRSDELTFISVIAAAAVVYLHVNGSTFWEFSRERYWITANVIECFFYFAVPVFYMISGITLIDFRERYSVGKFFQKRISKTVSPYIFWSIFGLLFRMNYLGDIKKSQINGQFLLNGFLEGNLVPIYWFFIPLFCIYLSMPVISLIDKNRRSEAFRYMAFWGILLTTIQPFVISVMHWTRVKSYVSFYVCAQNLLWVPLGWLLFHERPGKKKRYLLYLAGAGAYLLNLIGTQVVSYQAGQVLRTFKGYLNVTGVFYGIAAFVLLLEIGRKAMKHEKFARLIRSAASYTFPVYLIHWYIIQIILKDFNFNRHSIFFRIVAPVVIILISIGIAWIIRKIPLLRKLLP